MALLGSGGMLGSIHCVSQEVTDVVVMRLPRQGAAACQCLSAHTLTSFFPVFRKVVSSGNSWMGLCGGIAARR